MNSGKLIIGILAGVAAGAILGILFAPEKGSVTREKIAQKGEDYANSLKEKFNEFLDSMTQKFDDAKDEAMDYAEETRRQAERTTVG